MKLKRLLRLLFAICACISSFAQSHPSADLVITNAKIWTVDKAHPRAEAVAVIGDRIVAVWSDSEIDGWRDSLTQGIDVPGKLLLPRVNDTHVQFVSGGAPPE